MHRPSPVFQRFVCIGPAAVLLVVGAVFAPEPILAQPMADRLAACGWRAVRADGHDVGAMQSILRSLAPTEGPTALVFDTVKGQGVPFMVGDHGWHYRRLTNEDYARALERLG